MTLSSDELNYLIWRYLQEQGLEVSAFALQDETSVNKYDSKYQSQIPLGCLINLIQKGILYCEEDSLVDQNGEIIHDDIAKKFNLFGALEKDKLNNPTTAVNEIDYTASNGNSGNGNSLEVTKKESSPTISETFTTVLTKSFTFPRSQTNDWNPRSSAVLAWGQRDSSSVITVLNDSDKAHLKTLSSLTLEHPSLSSTSSTQDNDITVVKWSNNGDMLLTALESGELRLWTTDGKLKNVMMLHNSPILSLKWHGEYILSKDNKKTIIWDSRSGLALHHLEETQSGLDACFIDDSKIAVPSSDYSIAIYDFVNSTQLSRLYGHTDNIGIVDYSPILKLLLTVSDDLSIRIWKGESTTSTQILVGHSQLITYCNWLHTGQLDSASTSIPSGAELLLSTSIDGSIRIWNIYSGEIFFLAVNGAGNSILQAQMSPDSNWLATGDVDGVVTIWDISIDALNKNFKKRLSNNEGTIKNVSQYEPDIEVDDNFVSAINWSQDSKKVTISYSEIDSVVLCI